MVESISEAEKVGELKEVDLVQKGDRTLGIQRDPSFSGWCGEEGSFHSEYQLSESDTRLVNFNFEVPLLQQGGQENGFVDKGSHHCKKTMSSSTDNNEDDVSQPEVNNGSERYVSFDLENGYSRETSTSNVHVDGSDTASDYEKLMAGSKNPLSVANISKTLILILMWYTFSTFLTLYNKTLLGDNLGKFPAPLLMNTVHFGMQAVSAKAITWFWSSRFQPNVKMSWRDYFLRVVPTALGTALDINLSNESLVFISVTFATMCKSAAPIFLVLFAFAFRLESPSFKLVGIISIISAGVLLAVSRETEFDFWGFVFVMLAALTSGFRWCMTQLLLQKDDYGLKNPVTLMSYVAPVMTVLTAVLSLILDPWDQFLGNNYFNSPWHVTRSSLLMLFGGALAFFMVITEYILVSATSAVTVTIAGVVKEAVTIMVAVFYFHDEFTWLKGVGLITIMVGVGLFNWYKYQKLRKRHTSGDEMSGSATTNTAPRYVILEETDDRDDET